MKGDMRFTMPLWQMGMILILIVLSIVITTSSELKIFQDGGFMFEMKLENWTGIVFSIGLLSYVVFLTLFLINISKHNRRFPDKKINMLTIKPQEYIADDELFSEVTKNATQKVYSYYSWALPVLVIFSLGGFWNRTAIIVGILVIALGQYWIYYRTMRKVFVDGGTDE